MGTMRCRGGNGAKMSDGPGCPQCGTTVEPHWDWCHACGFDPEGLMPPELRAASRVPSTVAAYGAPSPAIGPAPTAAPYPGPVGRPGAIPPPGPVWDMTPVPTKKKSNVLATLLIVFGGLAVVAVVAVVLVGPKLAKSVASTKAGAGAHDPVGFDGPDGTYRISLSGTPKAEDRPMNDGSTMHTYGWDGGSNAQFIAWAALPPTYDPSMEQGVLHAAVDGGITGHGISTPTTFAGHAAMKFTGTFEGLDGQGVIFVAGGRLWILMAGGPWASQDPQATAFLSSFALTPPT